jgi:hypothetical protein
MSGARYEAQGAARRQAQDLTRRERALERREDIPILAHEFIRRSAAPPRRSTSAQ